MYERLANNLPWFIAGTYWVISSSIICLLFPIEGEGILMGIMIVLGLIPIVAGFAYSPTARIEGVRLMEIRRRWFPILCLFLLFSTTPIVVINLIDSAEVMLEILFVVGALVAGVSLHFLAVGNAVRSQALSQTDAKNRKVLEEISDRITMSAECIAIGSGLLIWSGILAVIPGFFPLTISSNTFLVYTFILAGGAFFLYGSSQAAFLSPWYRLCAVAPTQNVNNPSEG